MVINITNYLLITATNMQVMPAMNYSDTNSDGKWCAWTQNGITDMLLKSKV